MAGELIENDYQVQIGSLLMGQGTSAHIQRLRGWFGQNVKSADSDLAGDGSVAGVDRLASKQLVLEVVFVDDDPEDLQEALDDFLTEWAIGGDKELHRQTASAHQYVVGRTRKVVVDDDLRHAGQITVVAEFMANDPTVLAFVESA